MHFHAGIPTGSPPFCRFLFRRLRIKRRLRAKRVIRATRDQRHQNRLRIFFLVDGSTISHETPLPAQSVKRCADTPFSNASSSATTAATKAGDTSFDSATTPLHDPRVTHFGRPVPDAISVPAFSRAGAAYSKTYGPAASPREASSTGHVIRRREGSLRGHHVPCEQVTVVDYISHPNPTLSPALPTEGLP